LTSCARLENAQVFEALGRIFEFDTSDTQVTPENLGAVMQQLDVLVADREEVVNTQVLQDISLHLDTISDNELKADQPLLMSRMSMLDPTKDPVKDGDFYLNEKNQMRDMEASYRALNGKELVFDGKGPFIDDEGRVHMPQEKLSDDGRPIQKQIDTLFLNVSTQGLMSNEPPQRELNRAAMRRLYQIAIKNDLGKEVLERVSILQRRLEIDRESNFELAEDISRLLLDMGAKHSINCFSGKDRTGALGAQLIYSQAINGIPPETSEGKRKLLERSVAKHVLHTATEVVRDNTGFRALKVAPLYLPLTTGRMRGFRGKAYGNARRISMYLEAAATFVLPAGKRGSGQLNPDYETDGLNDFAA